MTAYFKKLQVKEAVEMWKSNRQQRSEEAKRRKSGRVQNNDPVVLEVLKNVSQKGGISHKGGIAGSTSRTSADEPEKKRMLIDGMES